MQMLAKNSFDLQPQIRPHTSLGLKRYKSTLNELYLILIQIRQKKACIDIPKAREARLLLFIYAIAFINMNLSKAFVEGCGYT
jgi:hypothetical protein